MSTENFFDFRERLATKRGAGASQSRASAKPEEALTVSQLTSQIERALRSGLPSTLYVKGEVSNLNLHRASGHLYFTLKDANACIDCVMFRSDVARLKFMPTDGIELLAGGRVSVYAVRGRYQLYATTLAPLGRGALELAFQQLCEKLRREGLFDAARKRQPPRFPTRIALVTSRSTAALHDMLEVLHRYPWIKLMLYHVPVQGDGAAEMIADALNTLSRQVASVGGIDVVLLARGGGSLEDLWEFNEECVARAIVASGIPVVTGVGHEVDVSIADLVADYRAHTPTEAAQVVTSGWRTVKDLMSNAGSRLHRGLRTLVQDARQRLAAVARHEFLRRPTDRIDRLRQLLDERERALLHVTSERLRVATARMTRLDALLIEWHPRHVIGLKRQKLAELSKSLALVTGAHLKHRSQRVELLGRNLEALSPRAVLTRGYTITTRKKDGAIVRSSKDPRVGERLLTRFADGTVESTVEDQKQLPLFE
jgi:exodeoxyribonuclease VII large subunit